MARLYRPKRRSSGSTPTAPTSARGRRTASLSFGYWTESTVDYRQASREFRHWVLEKEQPADRGTVLNVACGNGTETFRIWEALRPEKIVAIDLLMPTSRTPGTRRRGWGWRTGSPSRKPMRCTFIHPSNRMSDLNRHRRPRATSTPERIPEEGLRPARARRRVVAHGRDQLQGVCREPVGLPSHSGQAQRETVAHAKGQLDQSAALPMPVEGIGFAVESVESIGHHVSPGFVWSTQMVVTGGRDEDQGGRIGIGLTFISWLLGRPTDGGCATTSYARALKPARPASPVLARERPLRSALTPLCDPHESDFPIGPGGGRGRSIPYPPSPIPAAKLPGMREGARAHRSPCARNVWARTCCGIASLVTMTNWSRGISSTPDFDNWDRRLGTPWPVESAGYGDFRERGRVTRRWGSPRPGGAWVVAGSPVVAAGWRPPASPRSSGAPARRPARTRRP